MAFLCPLESFPCFIPLSSLFLCKFPAVDRHPYLPVCSVWGGGEPLLSLVCVWAVFVGVPVSALQTLLNRPVPTLTILWFCEMSDLVSLHGHQGVILGLAVAGPHRCPWDSPHGWVAELCLNLPGWLQSSAKHPHCCREYLLQAKSACIMPPI